MTGGGDARTTMRRRDRGKDDGWIREFLTQARWGVAAFTDDGGQPFVNANLFWYDPERHAVYLHTARTGRTPGLLARERPVCFTTSEMGRLLPADEALEFSVEYAGVVVFGPGVTVADGAEARAALDGILRKYAPHLEPDRDYRGITDEEMARTAVFRIDVESWSGKAKTEADDFPGAFHVPAPSLLPGAFRGEGD